MTCPFNEYKLLAYIEDDLSEEERDEVLRHIAGCSECAGLIKRYERQGVLLGQYYRSLLEAALNEPKPALTPPAKEKFIIRSSIPMYAVAVILIFLTVTGISVLVNHLLKSARKGLEVGTVLVVEGQAQYFKGDKLQFIKTGMSILSGMRFKTTRDSYLSLGLNGTKSTGEANIVEVRGSSFASFHDYKDRTELVLERGEVWVHLNSKPPKRFAVRTNHGLIQERGTIFNVTQGVAGVSVGVVIGEVDVEKGGATQQVNPGEMFFTFTDMSGDNIRRHVVWSHYRDRLLALLGPEKQSDREAQGIKPLRVRKMPVPQETPTLPPEEGFGTLTPSQLMPPDTLFFIEAYSLPYIIKEWEASDYSRLLKDPEMVKWWDGEGMKDVRGRALKRYGMAEWVALARAINGPASCGFSPTQGLIIVADCRQDVKTVEAIVNERIRPILKSIKESLGNYRADVAQVEVKRGYLVIGWGEKGLKKTLQAISEDKPTGFTEDRFYNNIRANLPNSRMTVAFDFHALLQLPQLKKGKDFNVFLTRAGLDNLDYLIVSPDFAGRGLNQAMRIAFDGSRHGVVGWLDEPGFMGSFRYFGSDAYIISAARLKSPQDMFREVMGWIFEDLGASAEPISEKTDKGFAIMQEIAGCMGHEFAIGVQNPLMPIPNIQMAIEITDPMKFHDLMLEYIDFINKLNPGLEIEMEGKEYRNKLIVSLSCHNLPFDISYVVLDDYLVIGPGEPFLRHTVDVFLEGHSIADERAFQNLLPAAGQTNFSLLIFQNVSNMVSGAMKQFTGGLSAQGRNQLPAFDILNKFQTAGISYAFCNDQYVDFYINGSTGMDFSMGGALPLVAYMMMPRVRYHDTEHQVIAAREGLRIADTALNSYYVDHNRYPASLEELVTPGNYMVTIPIDPFSEKGEALKYIVNSEGKECVIYSIGPDGTDTQAMDIYDPTNGLSSEGDILIKKGTAQENAQ